MRLREYMAVPTIAAVKARIAHIAERNAAATNTHPAISSRAVDDLVIER
jgi:hypothetical protein